MLIVSLFFYDLGDCMTFSLTEDTVGPISLQVIRTTFTYQRKGKSVNLFGLTVSMKPPKSAESVKKTVTKNCDFMSEAVDSFNMLIQNVDQMDNLRLIIDQ